MARNPMQDILPKGRSIRNVSIPSKHKGESVVVPIKKIQEKVDRLEHKLEKEQFHLEKEESHLEKEQFHINALRKARAEFEMHHAGGRKGGKNKKRLWFIGSVALVVVLALLISTVFHGASILVSPKIVAANVAGDYVAKRNAVKGELVFETITLKQTATESVKASGEETVNKKATGVIVIYNNYNAASQRLIKNTRFETAEGLIYRVSDSVTVPGKSGNTPGSAEAVVTADEAGEKYNSSPKDFTIPGFKGDPRYTTFYARSKTALAGGFSGTRKVVADTDRKKAEDSIRSKLRTALVQEIKRNVSEDKLFFDKSYSIDFVSLPEESLSGSEVLMKIEGTISAAVFDRQAFGSHLASRVIKNYQGDAVAIEDPESIFFNPKSDFRPASGQTIAFSLSGTPSFEWLYDEEALKTALRGVGRKEVVAVLQKFPMIEKADISIRPFWRGSFPDLAKRITIKKAE